MAFLTIVGVGDIEVSVEGAQQLENVVVGERRRTFDGTMRSSVRATKRQWRVVSPILTQVQETAIRNATTFDFVSVTGDLVGNVSISCLVTLTESDFMADGLSWRRRLVLSIEEA